MKIGISTGCFYPNKTDECLKKVIEAGAKYTEIFFNTDSELNEDFLKKLKNIADDNGVKIVSIHPFTSAIETFMFFSKTDYKLEDSIKYYERYFRACKYLGAKYVVIHGCFDSVDYMNMKRYAEILNMLSQKAAEYDVYISQENVVKFKCGYLENLNEFIKYADPKIKFVFDLKQCLRANQNVYDILNLMGKRISHIHISDFTEYEVSLLPGKGNFDFKTFFDYVSEKFDVDTSMIEVYNHNIDGISSVKKSLQFLADKI